MENISSSGANISLFKIYNVDPRLYVSTPIYSLPLSSRVINILLRNNILHASQLFELSPNQLKSIFIYNKRCIKEILSYCESLTSSFSFAQKYCIDTKQYVNTPISSISLSNRARRILTENNISTVQILLDSSAKTLISLPGFGENCLNEITKFCDTIKSKQNSHILQKNSNQEVIKNQSSIPLQQKNSLSRYAEYIKHGDFSFKENLHFSSEELLELTQYQMDFNVLGEELVATCISSPNTIRPICNMLESFYIENIWFLKVMALKRAIPAHRRNKKAYPYINVFTTDGLKRTQLRNICNSENSTIEEMGLSSFKEDDPVLMLFLQFLDWCSFNLESEINQVLETLYDNDRTKSIIQNRAKGVTLEQAGSKLDITRERVRQIEKKAKRKFSIENHNIKILPKISAERNGDFILTPAEITDYFGHNISELLFFLQSCESKDYTYDSQLNVFILGEEISASQVNEFIETLPKIIEADRLTEILNAIEEEKGIPSELLERAFQKTYHIAGHLYYRGRFPTSEIYLHIIRKYFPNGIHIYDSNELLKFREYFHSEFGDNIALQNDRALAAYISRLCILSDRGVYKPKQEKYIPDELANRIYSYIMLSNDQIFLTNTIFMAFKKSLLPAGIKNKYHLQGVLHELFGDKLSFSRDYISKNKNITSIYNSIEQYIKKSSYPVSKSQIKAAFPGISDIVISFATDNGEILNYFGQYIHSSHLKLPIEDRKYLESLLNNLLGNKLALHAKEVYEIINYNRPEILKRNSAFSPFSCFSILEYLFKDQFQFSRPYIALKHSTIARPAERLHDLIYGQDEFNIIEIRIFSKENHYQIQSLLEYINSCNDEFLLINKSTMMRISNTGITEEIAKDLDHIISQEIQSTIPIRDLILSNRLPSINVPWTDWLIYSTLNKWGEKTVVATTSNQFKAAVPLIALVGEMDISAFTGLIPNQESNSIKIDNLDDIDRLLENILDDDLWEEDI